MEKIRKKTPEKYQNLYEEEKAKNINTLENDTEIFRKRKKTKCVSMVENNIFLKLKNKV